MRLNRLAVLLAAASCSATIAPSAWAQDARRDELVHRVQSERLAAEQADQGKVLVSLDFPGGTPATWSQTGSTKKPRGVQSLPYR